ncbi:MAG: rhodanese-like domain-containing protein [Deltaproteobacteria bacterium]|nr:rhodanese-like domain-containing protein [Deltaproteobacteria bacterium]
MHRPHAFSRKPPAAFCPWLLPRLVAYLLPLFFSANAYGQTLQYITAPEVKNMMENDPRTVVIDTLSKIEYDGLHITGSINIPVLGFRSTTLLPADRTVPLITYCMGHD